MIADFSKTLRILPFVQDFIMSRTLFHELGHHIHGTIASAARSSEVAANEWRDRLAVLYFRKRYWYLVPLFRVLRLLLIALRWLTPRWNGRATRAAHRGR